MKAADSEKNNDTRVKVERVFDNKNNETMQQIMEKTIKAIIQKKTEM